MHTDPIAQAREAYAVRTRAAEAALQVRLANLRVDDPEAARDINSPASIAAYAPYYAVLKAARADYDLAVAPVLRRLYAA